MSDKKWKAGNSENSENSENDFGVQARNSETLWGRFRICAALCGSADALSRNTGIPRRTLETYLTGEAEPKIGKVVAVAKAVGVRIAWLATGEGPMRPEMSAGMSTGETPSAQAAQGLAGDVGEAVSGLMSLLENRELAAILQLVAALSPDERREIYQVAAEKKRLGDLEQKLTAIQAKLDAATGSGI